MASLEVVLERMCANASKVIHQDAFRQWLGCNPRVTAHRPEDMYAVIFTMMDYIWAQNMGHHEFKWPRDWWQAFRERWCPRWWLARHPVLYHHKGFQVHVAYPTFRPPEPLKNKPFVWKVQEKDWDGGRTCGPLDD